MSSLISSIESIICEDDFISTLYSLTCSQRIKGMFTPGNIIITEDGKRNLLSQGGVRIFDSLKMKPIKMTPSACKLVPSVLGRKTYKQVYTKKDLNEKRDHYVGNWVIMKKKESDPLRCKKGKASNYRILCGFFDCSRGKNEIEEYVRHMHLCKFAKLANQPIEHNYTYMVSGLVIIAQNGPDDLHPEIFINMDSGTWVLAKKILQYKLQEKINEKEIIEFARPHMERLLRRIKLIK